MDRLEDAMMRGVGTVTTMISVAVGDDRSAEEGKANGVGKLGQRGSGTETVRRGSSTGHPRMQGRWNRGAPIKSIAVGQSTVDWVGGFASIAGPHAACELAPAWAKARQANGFARSTS